MNKSQRIGLALLIAGSIGAASSVPAVLIVFFMVVATVGALLFILEEEGK